MVGQMKQILAAEQKKTDFKPEDENNVFIQYTTVSYIWNFTKKKATLNKVLTRVLGLGKSEKVI